MSRRTSIYFDEARHQAVRMKSAALGRSVSHRVHDAVRRSLSEDAEDFAALTARANEPSMSFESVVADLQARRS